MIELILKFRDENGREREVVVDSQTFTIGRHSSNDLAFPNGKLSREHVKIERVGGDFIVTDCGSSNGTELNGEDLFEPAKLYNGDRLNLGGGLDIEIAFDEPDAAGPQADARFEDNSPDEPQHEAATASVESAPPVGANIGGLPMTFFIMAPILGLVLVVSVVGLIYVFRGTSTAEITTKNGRSTSDSDDPSDPDVRPSPSKTTAASTPSNSGNGGTTSTTGSNSTAPPANLSENAKVEQNGAAFLRRIAQNDPKAFLTGDQTKTVASKIKQLAGSSALADNINSARKNSAAISSLATSKNLKPQLLATAALAKLGGSRGDAAEAARSMADILEKLNTQVGSELADDSLLMIAAYDQGAAGDFMRLRNMLQALATKSPESSRAIRTIWFLQKNGKITPAEFEFALRFLAIGAITQNPKDFGVNTDALVL